VCENPDPPNSCLPAPSPAVYVQLALCCYVIVIYRLQDEITASIHGRKQTTNDKRDNNKTIKQTQDDDN